MTSPSTTKRSVKLLHSSGSPSTAAKSAKSIGSAWPWIESLSIPANPAGTKKLFS